MKASFTNGFAKARLAEKRAPMVAKLDTGDTVISFETSFKQELSWPVYEFLNRIAAGVDPAEAFDKSFKKSTTQQLIHRRNAQGKHVGAG